MGENFADKIISIVIEIFQEYATLEGTKEILYSQKDQILSFKRSPFPQLEWRQMFACQLFS